MSDIAPALLATCPPVAAAAAAAAAATPGTDPEERLRRAMWRAPKSRSTLCCLYIAAGVSVRCADKPTGAPAGYVAPCGANASMSVQYVVFQPGFTACTTWRHRCVHLSSRLPNYSRQLLEVSTVINTKKIAQFCKLGVILQAVQEQHQQARICDAAAGGRGGREGAGARSAGSALERSGGAGGGLGGRLPPQALWLSLFGGGLICGGAGNAWAAAYLRGRTG